MKPPFPELPHYDVKPFDVSAFSLPTDPLLGNPSPALPTTAPTPQR